MEDKILPCGGELSEVLKSCINFCSDIATSANQWNMLFKVATLRLISFIIIQVALQYAALHCRQQFLPSGDCIVT